MVKKLKKNMCCYECNKCHTHKNRNKLTFLSSDCWLIQFSGLLACEACEAKNTADCDGGDMLANLIRG